MLLIVWQGLTNKSALFLHGVVMLLLNLFFTLAPRFGSYFQIVRLLTNRVLT